MLKKLLIVFFILLASFASAEAADEPQLRVLLDRAAANSPIIKAAASRVAQVRADVRAASSQRGPSVYAIAGALWNKDALGTAAISPVTGMPIAVVPMSSRNVYAAGIVFLQSIYDGGSRGAKKRAEEFALEAARAEELRAYQSVMSNVRECFHTARRAASAIFVAKQGHALAAEHLKRAEAMRDAGLVPVGDVLRVKVAVSQSELDIIRAQNALDVALVALERLVGEPVPPSDVIPDRLTEGADIATFLDPTPIALPGDAESIALAERPEVRAYAALKQRADQLAKAARGARLPHVYAAGELLQVGDSFWPKDNDSWHVQLGVEWNIYDGGRSDALEQKARSAAEELLHATDDLAGKIRQEVSQAELGVASAQSRLQVALDQMKTAEEDHRMAVKRYEAHVGTNIDVLDAHLALDKSRTQYVDAFCDREIAYSSLLYAVGSDVPDIDIEGEDAK